MDIHSASRARANLFKLLEQTNQESESGIITSGKGDEVLISKDDWESMQKTFWRYTRFIILNVSIFGIT